MKVGDLVRYAMKDNTRGIGFVTAQVSVNSFRVMWSCGFIGCHTRQWLIRVSEDK